MDTKNTNQQQLLSTLLVKYVELINSPFNNDDTNELIISLNYIRAALCQRYKFGYAARLYRKIRLLIQHMINRGYFKGGDVDGICFLMCTLNKSQYESCKAEKIPLKVSLKFKDELPKSDVVDNAKNLPLSTIVTQRLEYLSKHLNSNVFELIAKFLYQSNNRRKTQLSFLLKIYIEVLHEAINNNDTGELAKSLNYIRIDLCQRHSFSSSKVVIGDFQMLVKYMIEVRYFKEGSIDELDAFLVRLTEPQFKIIKSEIIPKEILNNFSHEFCADEKFEDVLNSTCNIEIADRLQEHVNSFKHKTHHRHPLILFLRQISASNPKWYKHPKIIQGELLKFRDNLLNLYTRNTAYSKFQNVKNSISVLIKHGLLPQFTEMPDNLRRCTNTEKIRKDNPLICEIDMYDEKKRDSYVNTQNFIESLKNELSNNLSILVKDAQNIVFKAYHHFCDKEAIVKQSQFDEFMKHPELLVNKTKGSRSKSKVNPFYSKHPLRLSNLTAYYDHYFNDMIQGKIQHQMNYLALNEEVIGYLGLTIKAASAMQTIITEELGINAYSLYNVKISSDSHGHEFVQVDDEGSVRIKALKLRAKNARTRSAVGNNTPLADINVDEINAAACLKMALEMTSRIRKSLGVKDLWVCLTKLGVSVSSEDSFQYHFNNFSKQASSKSTILQHATLKKVRSSKGVLIYLQTNGDSIETATYFGNTVKTTLNRYIPAYLTELIYRVKIRNFQNIFLFMAVSSDESPSKSLNMSKNNFEFQLKKAFNNPDMGGSLYEKLTHQPNENEENNHLYFCVSDLNLQLAIRYTIYGEDEELKNNCNDVLNKIGKESSLVMKSMLRKAQAAVEQGKG